MSDYMFRPTQTVTLEWYCYIVLEPRFNIVMMMMMITVIIYTKYKLCSCTWLRVNLRLLTTQSAVTLAAVSKHRVYPRFGFASAMLMQILVFWDKESVKIGCNRTFSEKPADFLCYV